MQNTVEVVVLEEEPLGVMVEVPFMEEGQVVGVENITGLMVEMEVNGQHTLFLVEEMGVPLMVEMLLLAQLGAMDVEMVVEVAVVPVAQPQAGLVGQEVRLEGQVVEVEEAQQGQEVQVVLAVEEKYESGHGRR
jgi:hypothetical protein